MIETVSSDTPQRPERAALIGLVHPGHDAREAEESLAELGRLVDSAGGEVAGEKLLKLRVMRAATLLSKGHVEETADWIAAVDCDLAVVDEDLSPGQQRNLEKAFGVRTLTRTQVILDIFALHAKTREAMTQVELAQLRYLAPRLVGASIASARMGGASGSAGRIATRGPGETQLEVDRRRLRARVARLETDLKEIKRRRETQRRRRLQSGLPLVGIAGYTNAGKSTLLNRLTHAGILAEDRLFSTLDTTVRSLVLPNGLEVGLVDTVGFVGKLPPTLVAAFRATLEEISYADLILQIVDASSSRRRQELETTDGVLKELDCETTPRLTVFNKMDLVEDPLEINALALERAPSARISALRGDGIDALLAQIETLALAQGRRVLLLLPYDRYDLVARLHREAQVLESRDTPGGVLLHCRLPEALAAPVEPFRINEADADALGD